MPHMEKQEIERLARALADTVKGVRPTRIRLRMLEPPKSELFDSITREACLRRIRFLTQRYSLAWLVEQETFDTPGIECASDQQLSDTLKALENARECLQEGIPFEDAGLIRNTGYLLPPTGDFDHA